MDFYPDFFHVGNIEGNLSAIGCAENDMEDRVRKMVSDLKYQYGLCIPTYKVTEELKARDIPYVLLPQYMKDMIDELDVY